MKLKDLSLDCRISIVMLSSVADGNMKVGSSSCTRVSVILLSSLRWRFLWDHCGFRRRCKDQETSQFKRDMHSFAKINDFNCTLLSAVTGQRFEGLLNTDNYSLFFHQAVWTSSALKSSFL